MPLNFSAAHSSRITKKSQHKIPALKRWASSPLTNTTSCNQRKLLGRSPSKAEVAGEGGDDLDGECLDDVGTITSLASDRSLRDVAQIIQYVYSHSKDYHSIFEQKIWDTRGSRGFST